MHEEFEKKPISKGRWVIFFIGVGCFVWLTGSALAFSLLVFDGQGLEWLEMLMSACWAASVVGLALGACPDQWFRMARRFWLGMLALAPVAILDGFWSGLAIWTGIFLGGAIILDWYAHRSGLVWKKRTGLGLVFAIVFVGRIWDFPAIQDPKPEHFMKLEAAGVLKINNFHSYDLGSLGGFRELWTMNATDEAVGQLAEVLGLESVSEFDVEFLDQKPYYWPKVRPDESAYFESSNGKFEGRQGSPVKYRLLHVPDQNQVFVLRQE